MRNILINIRDLNLLNNANNINNKEPNNLFSAENNYKINKADSIIANLNNPGLIPIINNKFLKLAY